MPHELMKHFESFLYFQRKAKPVVAGRSEATEENQAQQPKRQMSNQTERTLVIRAQYSSSEAMDMVTLLAVLVHPTTYFLSSMFCCCLWRS